MPNSRFSVEQLEQKVQDLENQLSFYKSLLDHNLDWQFFSDKNGRIIYSNPALERITGFNVQEYVNGSHTLKDLIHPDDFDYVCKQMEKISHGHVIESCSYRIIKKDQSIAYCECASKPVFSDNGEFLGFSANVKDITKSKTKEFSFIDKLNSALYNQLLSQKQVVEKDTIIKHIGSNLKDGAIFQAYVKKGKIDKFSFLSEGIQNIIGYSADEIIKKPSLYEKSIISGQEKVNFLNSSETHSQLCYYEQVIDVRTQETKWLYIIASPKLIDEKVICWDGIILDHTELRKADKILKDSEEKFRVLFEKSPDIIAIADLNGNIIDCNESALKFYGYCTKEEILKLSIFDFYVKSNDPANAIENILKKGHLKDFEIQVKTCVNEIHDMLISVEIIELLGKDPIFIFWQKDVTERKKNELAIKKLSSAVDQSPVAIVITDLDGFIEYVNPFFSKISGYSFEESIGNNPKLLKTDYHSADFYKNLWKTIRAGKIWKGEFLNKNKNGNLFWEKATIGPIFNEKQEIISFLAVKEDITEKKRAEEALRESEEKLRAIFNSANVGISIMNVKGEFLMVNETWLHILGYKEDEMIGMYHVNIVHPDDIGLSVINLSKLKKGVANDFRIEKRYIKKDKSIIWVDLSVSTIKDNEGNLLFFTFVITDITAQKHAVDEKMLHTMIEAEEKERTRIAQELHDGVGPVLSSAKMYSQLLISPTSKMDKNEVAHSVEELLVEAQSIVRQISYSLSPHILQNFGLIEALKSFARKITDASNMKINISNNNTKLLSNHLDTLLYRSLCECINNTIKHAKASEIDIIINFTEEDVKIQYRDNGIGFDFAQTLHEKTGVGLFNMMNRVKMIDGKIDISSQPGNGVYITIDVRI